MRSAGRTKGYGGEEYRYADASTYWYLSHGQPVWACSARNESELPVYRVPTGVSTAVVLNLTDDDVRSILERGLAYFDDLAIPEVKVVVVTFDEWLRAGHPTYALALTDGVTAWPPVIYVREDCGTLTGNYMYPQLILIHELMHVVDILQMGWTTDMADNIRNDAALYIARQENWIT